MTDLLLARSQMAMSLGFHIIFASIGVALPVLMVIAEWKHLRTGDPVYLKLAKQWAKGTAILFAVGAVSGTVLSFELGLLWPGFMKHAGAIIGMPFSLEGFAFFTEAIFLGIYLYGWQKVSPRKHLLAGVAVAVSGALSAFFVVLANAWMNTPRGFRFEAGQFLDIDPIAAMFSPGWHTQVTHVLLASYLATAAAMAAIHALGLLRNPASRFHKAALDIALLVLVITAVLQPISGHSSAQSVAVRQPAKLAAMEGHFTTERRAPLHLGGLPDVDRREVRYAIKIPYGLSILAFNDPNAEVTGFDRIPRDQWPNTLIVHLAFQAMVAAGTALMGVAAWAAYAWWRGRRKREEQPYSRLLLLALIACGPLGFLAVEAGWVVTEVGRQPWTIYGVLRTADAVTPATGLGGRFVVFALVYVLLAVVVAAMLWKQIRATYQASEP